MTLSPGVIPDAVREVSRVPTSTPSEYEQIERRRKCWSASRSRRYGSLSKRFRGADATSCALLVRTPVLSSCALSECVLSFDDVGSSTGGFMLASRGEACLSNCERCTPLEGSAYALAADPFGACEQPTLAQASCMPVDSGDSISARILLRSNESQDRASPCSEFSILESPEPPGTNTSAVVVVSRTWRRTHRTPWVDCLP